MPRSISMVCLFSPFKYTIQCWSSVTCLQCFSIHPVSSPAGSYWPFNVSLCDMLQSNVSKIIKKKKIKKNKEKNHSLRGDQFSSVAHSCPTLCYPMNRSKPGLPVHHQVPWVTQTHVHWVGVTIHPSHPLTSPSPPALNHSQQQDAIKWASSSHQVAKL